METQKLTELVISAQKGDKIAMDTLVSESYQELYYYVLKTVKNENLAYDVTQESFIEIITTMPDDQGPTLDVNDIYLKDKEEDNHRNTTSYKCFK